MQSRVQAPWRNSPCIGTSINLSQCPRCAKIGGRIPSSSHSTGPPPLTSISHLLLLAIQREPSKPAQSTLALGGGGPWASQSVAQDTYVPHKSSPTQPVHPPKAK
jgi:hypothetical protein